MGRMGLPWSKRLKHVSFGVMRVGGRRLRTREGGIVLLNDVLEQSVAVARTALLERSPDMVDVEATARSIGVGAVIFNDLKHNRDADVD